MEKAFCQICGPADFKVFLTRMDRFSGETFQYVQCSNCGEIYLNPRPTIEEISSYYPSGYESYGTFEESPNKLQQHLLWKNQERVLNYVERFALKTGTLLDVGCSTGQFLRVARQHGWQVKGTELVDQVAKIARNRYGLDVVTGTLEDIPLPLESFDLVTFWDVLEHLYNPRRALEIIHSLLTPSGILAIGFPNMDSYDRKLFGSNWIGWDAPRHLYLFCMSAFQRLFAETGFELVGTRCITGGKGSFMLSLDFVLKDRPISKWVDLFKPAISALLLPYRQWSYLVTKGSNITIVARKKTK